MSSFNVQVVKLTIKSHPDADSLEIAIVDGYEAVVRKGQFKTGDFAVYIPEQSVLQPWLIEQLGLVGKLSGSKKNRVRACKLRGILSQGLILPVIKEDEVIFLKVHDIDRIQIYLEQDVKDILQIEKYEPKIPISLSGEVGSYIDYTLKFDIENIKKYPSILTENEDVVFTEKLHGTWCCYSYQPDFGVDSPLITSKGLSAKGLIFKLNENNENNVYIKTFNKINENNSLMFKLKEYFNNQPVYLLGEIYGVGIQDLTYGQKTPTFNAFDIYVGTPRDGRFLSFEEFVTACNEINMSTVPVLYTGKFNYKLMLEMTKGLDSISKLHIREGIVIKSLVEKKHFKNDRIILKSVSEDYLLRKNATEYN